MEEYERRFNKFFYRMQHERMLGLGYLFLTKEGFIFLAIALIAGWFWMSFYYIFAVAAGFAYIYLKKYNKQVGDRESIWLFAAVRKWLGIRP